MLQHGNSLFLDRDGVINDLILNKDTGCYESPKVLSQFFIKMGLIEFLREAQKKYNLFIITNQPDYAKGKATMEDLEKIRKYLRETFRRNEIQIVEDFYCYHHEDGINENGIVCNCRKPKTGFLEIIKKRYGLDFKDSYFIGDSWRDIYCGQAMNMDTIMIHNNDNAWNQMNCDPEYRVRDFVEILKLIL